MSIGGMLAETAKRFPDKTAIILGDSQATFGYINQASNRVANFLLGSGIKKGDRVALLLNNSAEFVILFFGIIKSGAVAAPLDTRYRIEELLSVCGNCRPRLLFADKACIDYISPYLSQFDYIEKVISLEPEPSYRYYSYQEITANSPDESPRVETSEDDLVTLVYSSGPSTHPHGAMFTHRNLLTEAEISARGFDQTDKDAAILYALPLHHMFGLTTILMTSFLKGSTVVIVPGTGVSISTMLESVEKHRATLLMGVPYIFSLAIKMARREGIKYDLSSLRVCTSGGAPLPIETVVQFKRYFGIPLGDLWGLTEAVSQVTSQPIDGSGKLGSCGKVLPGWELKVVGNDDRKMPVNQSGELIVRGPFTRGYYSNPGDTALAIRDGWLHTGDIGKIDKDGFVYITGRKKRMIILKGQNIYPDDIEATLGKHPKIATVTVEGVPDKLRGEIVKAKIYLKPGETATEQEIRHYCQERMADYKCPKKMVIRQSRARACRSKFATG